MSDIDGNHWNKKSDESSTEQDDSGGVSPVIGVILMVTITIIVTSIVGSFTLNLASGIEENPEKPQVVVSEPTQNKTVVVKVLSFPDDYEYISVHGPTETHQITTTRDLEIDGISDTSVITITGTYDTGGGLYSEGEQTTILLYEKKISLHS